MSKKMIIFYSRADENYVSGDLKNLTIGNTELVAAMIQEFTGADIFKIEQEHPYSKSYNNCIAEAKADQQNNARPKLKSYPPSLAAYDEIYLGYPNYWSTMPMAIFTFLEQYSLDGKIIKPFCTHEGSGLGKSIADIERLCPNAIVDTPLVLYGSHVVQSHNEIKRWIQQ